MNVSENELKSILNTLYQEACKEDANIKLIIAKAFSAGMKYQEDKIKYGINNVFANLNLPS